jgi:hypothetical protein
MLVATAITAMAAPRIARGGLPLGLYLPAAWFSMVLVSGMATAWSKRAGMAGVFPDRRTALAGAGAGLLTGVALAPMYWRWVDPPMRTLLAATSGFQLELQYPSDAGGVWALVLWVAGFQTMFLRAAPMALFARLTGRREVAMLLVLAFGGFVTVRQLREAGIAQHPGLAVLAVQWVAAGAGCVLYARAGLPAVVALGAVLECRHFAGIF